MAFFNFRRWLASQSRPAGTPIRRRNALRPRLASLEERVVPATFVVSNTNDSGAGSLRAAITSANATVGADIIDATGVSGTITLLSRLPNIADDVTINGSGAGNLTVTRDAAAANFRIFTVARALGPKLNVTIRGMTVSNGIGTPDIDNTGGGGIATQSEHVVLDGLVITGNRASGPGGGIDTRSNSDLTIMNTTISGNSSGTFGGGLYAGNDGRIVVVNSTVSGNTAGLGGGGLYFYGDAAAATDWIVQNSTISGNLVTATGTTGAGIQLLGNGNRLTVRNSTITANQAQYGAGIVADNANDTIVLESTIVSGNVAGSPGRDIYVAGGVQVSAKNSAIGDMTGGVFTDNGGNLAPGTPVNLGPLANNGGPTQTHLPLAGSPVIDAGFNAIVQGVDQRGFQRTAGSQVDIGAAEFGASQPAGNIPAVDVVNAFGATSYQVQVIYTDDTAVNVATLDPADITVTGPGGTATVTGVTVSPAGNGTPRTATYTITPPGGSWDPADNGTYIVRSVAGQVTDTSGNPITAGIIGQFRVALTVVTTAADSGAGSLREAIVAANTVTGIVPTISFAVGTGPVTISPTSALPAITRSVVIDGTTQPGYAGTPIVELAGNLAGTGATGLTLTASNNVVRGLVIDRFGGAGLLLTGGAGNVVQGNYIGTNAAGAAGLGNGTGVIVTGGGGGNLIGSDLDGTNDAAERNVISGNTGPGIRASVSVAPLRVFQWTTGAGGNNHFYVTTPATSWLNAETAAASVGGHLVSIGSAAEQSFIVNGGVLTDVNGNGWIGLTDNEAFGGTEFGNTSGSTTDASGNRGRGWVWTDGTTPPIWPTPTGYQNWNGGEPNDAGVGEDLAEITGGGGWNDNAPQNGDRRGILEFNTAPNLSALAAALGLIPNRIQGNYIGTNVAGTAAVGNGTGLEVEGASLTVRNNVVSGNTAVGISVGGAAAVVQGNLVGTNAAGTAAVANGIGVFVASANGALIGSDLDGTNDVAERNVISGNTTAGVRGAGASSLVTFAQWTTGTGANNHYYVRAAVNAGWVQAEQFAQAFGGHLVSIGSAEENAFVSGTLGGGWLGFTDDPAFGGQEFGNTSGAANRGEGWVWTDGTPAPYPVGGPLTGYMNWNAGEPNNAGAGENYAEIQASGGWNDLSTQTRFAIAEFTNVPNIAAILTALGRANNNRIQGNYIGTNAAGTAAIGNGTGLDLGGALGDTVRGNVISGNTGAGLTVSSTAVRGPDGHYYVTSPSPVSWTAAEAFAVSNGGHLVSVGSATEQAIILGVGTGWIGFTDDPAFGGQEFGNTSGAPNRGEGWVWSDGTPAPYPVGGPLVGYMNWNGGEPNNAGTGENYAEITGGGGWNDLPLSSNRVGIIELTTTPSAALLGAAQRTAGGLTVTGNIIGQNAANTGALANGGPGINVTGNTLVSIGGTAAGAGNTISGNNGPGVAVTGNTANATIRGNSISANAGLGIDLGTTGVNANDTLDGDTGPNALQNFPVLISVTAGATTTVSGNINSTANTALTIDFYASAAADPSGNGEGQRYLGSTTVTTDGFGNATFTAASLGATTAGEFISATATDPNGNTSEFALNATSGATAAPTVVSVVANGGGAQRSEVRSVVVTFSGPVTFTGGNGNAAAAFQLNRIGGGAVGLTSQVTTNGSGQTVVTLTFSGAETDPLSVSGTAVPVPGPSLVDGRYQLTILSANVSGAGGALDGDNNGTAGGDYQSVPDTLAGGPGQVKLYRLFGDATGNGVVDLADLAQLRTTFNFTSADPSYLNYLDANNNGVVDLTDLAQFRTRFNVVLLP